MKKPIPEIRQAIPQIATKAAQKNAYFICHNAADMLRARGYPAKKYPDTQPVDYDDEGWTDGAWEF